MTVWIDMDGVLADFDGGYRQRFGDPPCPLYATGTVEKAKWAKINSCGDFFLYLPLMPEAREMWDILEPTGAHILTTVSKSIPSCPTQKIQWCRRELGIGTDRIVYVVGKENKALYCHPGDVLLDDHEDNVRDWNNAGGTGILVTPHGGVGVAMTAYRLWDERSKRERNHRKLVEIP